MQSIASILESTPSTPDSPAKIASIAFNGTRSQFKLLNVQFFAVNEILCRMELLADFEALQLTAKDGNYREQAMTNEPDVDDSAQNSKPDEDERTQRRLSSNLYSFEEQHTNFDILHQSEEQNTYEDDTAEPRKRAFSLPEVAKDLLTRHTHKMFRRLKPWSQP